jgi:hypothetical protein
VAVARSLLTCAVKGNVAPSSPLHAAKREVVIYDYVDADETLLAKMASKARGRLQGPWVRRDEAGDLFSGETVLPMRRTA